MGAVDDEKGPERTCIATRRALPVRDLIRFVAGPGDILTPDIKARLPGRGVWVTCSRPALDEAIRRKAFPRSLKQAVTVPDGLADLVDTLLAVDARQSLSLANKAGLVVSGFFKVEAALASGRVQALVSAAGASEDGRRKLRQVVRRSAAGHPAPVEISVFPASELDLALGRENAIHAALLAGPASDAVLARCGRLEKFRSGGSGEVRPDAADQPASTGHFALDEDQERPTETDERKTQDKKLDDR